LKYGNANNYGTERVSHNAVKFQIKKISLEKGENKKMTQRMHAAEQEQSML
jgi:hypothetical protein